jgi:hypothetical protein
MQSLNNNSLETRHYETASTTTENLLTDIFMPLRRQPLPHAQLHRRQISYDLIIKRQ